LVKNPKSKKDKAEIFYKDIGDYLSREDKLKIIKVSVSVASSSMKWRKLSPNEHGDWINQRNDQFGNFIPIGDKKGDDELRSFFNPFYSNGLKTQRDVWCYNSSKELLEQNIHTHIDQYNSERKRLQKQSVKSFKDFLDRDESKGSWTRALINDAEKNKEIHFKDGRVEVSSYRPFFKQYLYHSRALNEMVYQIPKLFPDSDIENLVICVSASYKDGSVLMTNLIPDLHLNGDTQAFPLYYYEEASTRKLSLFDETTSDKYVQRDGISDFIFERFQKQYGKSVTKEDVFYYVYGLLHSPDYRTEFANDLSKMLPRIPMIESVGDYKKLVKAGRDLGELHVNYEQIPPPNGVLVTQPNGSIEDAVEFVGSGLTDYNFHVEKMRFPKKGQTDSIIYNSQITISQIPDKAYDYQINGKSAIEWIMERYQVKTDPKSGITNDPNDWAKEVGNPRYILDLLLSVINVSVQTVEIVEGLPELKFD
jgi:predicted helicase